MMNLRTLSYFSLSLVACGGSSLVGTWSGNNIPTTITQISAVDATVTFTAGDMNAKITAKDATNMKVADISAAATYTSTDTQITMTLTSVSGTNNSGGALTTSTSGMGTTEALCVTPPGVDPVCITKVQTSSYTIKGTELNTQIQTSTGTVIPLKLTKK